MKNSRILLSICCLAVLTPPAFGGEAQGWAIHSGAFDLAESSTAEMGVEYRLAPFSLKKVEIVPAFGLSGTSDGGVWLYGGLRYDWELSDHWIVTPSVGVSLFEEGDGKNLGGPIEFRSGLEISYRFHRRSRLGVLFYHLSNARIYDDNPGSNTLNFVWGLGR